MSAPLPDDLQQRLDALQIRAYACLSRRDVRRLHREIAELAEDAYARQPEPGQGGPFYEPPVRTAIMRGGKGRILLDTRGGREAGILLGTGAVQSILMEIRARAPRLLEPEQDEGRDVP